MKGKMPEFIQAMYGTVLGLSFYKFFDKGGPDAAKVLDQAKNLFKWPPDENTLFNLLFFVFTLIIAAHDWFSYHNRKEVHKDGFWWYVPQILSLFCLSQMFTTTTPESMRYWFAWGFFYTVFNSLSLISIHYNRNRLLVYGATYIVHFGITILFWNLLAQGRIAGENKILKEDHWYALWITGSTVLLIWILLSWVFKRFEVCFRYHDKFHLRLIFPKIASYSSFNKFTLNDYPDQALYKSTTEKLAFVEKALIQKKRIDNEKEDANKIKVKTEIINNLKTEPVSDPSFIDTFFAEVDKNRSEELVNDKRKSIIKELFSK